MCYIREYESELTKTTKKFMVDIRGSRLLSELQNRRRGAHRYLLIKLKEEDLVTN